MGRVISDLPSFSEKVANGDLLVCHNVSKAENTRDEKLTVEKLLTDGLGNLGVTIASGGNVGIGTTIPDTKLEIRGVSPVLRLRDSQSLGSGEWPGTILGGVEFFTSDNSFPQIGVAGAIRTYSAPDLGTAAPYATMGFFLRSTAEPAPEIMTIRHNGRVGIGTTTPAEELHVVGDVLASSLTGTGNRAVYSTGTGVLTNSSSDARMKTDVKPIGAGDALGLVDALRPVRYRWGAEYAETRGEQVEVGLIAQEVLAHVPEVIGENGDGMLSVDYPKLTALLIGAVQALAARVAALEGAG